MNGYELLGLVDPLTDSRVIFDEAAVTGVLAGPIMDTALVMGVVSTGAGLWSPPLAFFTAPVTLAVAL